MPLTNKYRVVSVQSVVNIEEQWTNYAQWEIPASGSFNLIDEPRWTSSRIGECWTFSLVEVATRMQ